MGSVEKQNVPKSELIVHLLSLTLFSILKIVSQFSKPPFIKKFNSSYGTSTVFFKKVGLHELLGHGSGKLLRHEADGTRNYSDTVLDPLSGKSPSSCYECGDTYDSLFGPLSSTYEECRAEAVGLYLSVEPAILSLFGHEGEQAEEILYVNWLSLIWNGIGRALETWDPKRGWLQAHAQVSIIIKRK